MLKFEEKKSLAKRLMSQFFLQLCNGWTCRVVRVLLPHTKVCKYSLYKPLLMMDRWGPKHVELKLKCWLKLTHWDYIVYLVALHIYLKVYLIYAVFNRCETFSLQIWVEPSSKKRSVYHLTSCYFYQVTSHCSLYHWTANWLLNSTTRWQFKSFTCVVLKK